LTIVCAVPAARAGSPEAPEVTDPAGDQAGGNAVVTGGMADIVAAWVESESVDTVSFVIQVAAPVEEGPTDHLGFTLRLSSANEAVLEAPVGEALDENSVRSVTVDGDRVTVTAVRNACCPEAGETMLMQVSSILVAGQGLVTVEDETALDAAVPYQVGASAEPGLDTDRDGIDDRDEAAAGTNPGYPDSDFDNLQDGDELTAGTDPADPDSDGDLLLDGDEGRSSNCAAEAAACPPHATDPLDSDSDDDGVLDGSEVALGIDPTNADTDGDGLPDGRELGMAPCPTQTDLDGTRGCPPATDPSNPDTDGDGLDDGTEVEYGLDPTDPKDAGADDDGDGQTNLQEILGGSDPTRAGSGWIEGNLALVFVLVSVYLAAILVTVVVRRRTGPEEPDIDSLAAKVPHELPHAERAPAGATSARRWDVPFR